MAATTNGEQFEQWRGAHQGQRLRALCTIIVDGQDVTRAFDPHLISVNTVTRRGGSIESDVAQIELDDREGRLAIPAPLAALEIWLGWQNESLGLAWKGQINDVESSFSRRGGARRLNIHAQGFQPYGLAKAHFRCAWGDGEGQEILLEQVLQEAGTAAGYSVRISPSLRGIKRKYWAQNESFLNFGSRLGQELGAYFKVNDDVATLTSVTDGKNVDGEELPTIDVVWGQNLISWRIKPYTATPQAFQASSVVYNKGSGRWESAERLIPRDLPFISEAVKSTPAPAPNMVTAEQWNVATEEWVRADRGVGSVVINGEPGAICGGRVNLKGARPGVDGLYGIDEVEHLYSRTAGFITTLTCKFPQLVKGPYQDMNWPAMRLPEEGGGVADIAPEVEQEMKGLS